MVKHLILIGNIKATPLGEVWAALSLRGLVAVDFGVSQSSFERAVRKQTKYETEYVPEQVDEIVEQIKEYLMGKRREFELKIDWSVLASDFQRDTLRAVFSIPYGETRTYAEIAAQIGHPQAFRAMGQRQRNKSHAAGHSLPSRHRHGWKTPRLRRQRRIENQGVVAEDGKRETMLLSCHPDCNLRFFATSGIAIT